MPQTARVWIAEREKRNRVDAEHRDIFLAIVELEFAELGFRAVEKKVHVHDLHATILHLLGFDHEKLTYRYAGRDFRLTDVHGQVIKDILA